MVCAGNESNFSSLFGKAEETIWQNYTQAYHNCSRTHRGLFSCNLFRFFSNCKRVVKSTFSVLLLKTLLAFPRVLQLNSNFGLNFFWLTKTHNLPNVNFFPSCCQKSQLVLMDFVIFQSIKCHYKMDIQTWCVATGCKEEEIFFCTVRFTHFEISWNKHLVCPQHEMRSKIASYLLHLKLPI